MSMTTLTAIRFAQSRVCDLVAQLNEAEPAKRTAFVFRPQSVWAELLGPQIRSAAITMGSYVRAKYEPSLPSDCAVAEPGEPLPLRSFALPLLLFPIASLVTALILLCELSIRRFACLRSLQI